MADQCARHRIAAQAARANGGGARAATGGFAGLAHCDLLERGWSMSPAKLLWRTLSDLLLAVLTGTALPATINYFEARRYIDNDGTLAVLAGVKALGIHVPYFEEQGKKQVGHLAGDFRQTPPDDQALA